ncbi:hypothetical protein I7I50_06981 [Histoplasma capsulatum G186AR]|uniref:Uncharacterized protein n=1 Tax=Ajellomyces capsulatus TaxID=5037 RepID=A0A8H7Z1V3_AJECA|nr:hypothetical protein I7I52_09945 [Histoplasma capsulatum]QSS67795.1 hypothetical protein I7I50_06981 [Histoplasma capsulatum G186AR]
MERYSACGLRKESGIPWYFLGRKSFNMRWNTCKGIISDVKKAAGASVERGWLPSPSSDCQYIQYIDLEIIFSNRKLFCGGNAVIMRFYLPTVLPSCSRKGFLFPVHRSKDKPKFTAQYTPLF